MSKHDGFPNLTPMEMVVLRQLSAAGVQGKYGLELVADSEGELKRGSIYVLLGRMEDKEFIDGRLEETPQGNTGPPRRVYTVTAHGKRVLAAYEMLARRLAS